MKRIVIGILIMSVLLFAGCSSGGEVKLKVKSRFENTMICADIKAKQEEPEYEEITAGKGTELHHGITVKSVSRDKNSVDIKIEGLYNGSTYSIKTGEIIKNYNSVDRLTLKKGERLMLSEIAILDASHTVYIEFD